MLRMLLGLRIWSSAQSTGAGKVLMGSKSDMQLDYAQPDPFADDTRDPVGAGTSRSSIAN
jgi:hypothetical protein